MKYFHEITMALLVAALSLLNSLSIGEASASTTEADMGWAKFSNTCNEGNLYFIIRPRENDKSLVALSLPKKGFVSIMVPKGAKWNRKCGSMPDVLSEVGYSFLKLEPQDGIPATGTSATTRAISNNAVKTCGSQAALDLVQKILSQSDPAWAAFAQLQPGTVGGREDRDGFFACNVKAKIVVPNTSDLNMDVGYRVEDLGTSIRVTVDEGRPLHNYR